MAKCRFVTPALCADDFTQMVSASAKCGANHLSEKTAMRRMLFLLVVLAGMPTLATAQSAADSAAIRATALDYIEGWYAGDAARMERALHPELAKRIVRTDANGNFRLDQQSAMTLVQGTRNGEIGRAHV